VVTRKDGDASAASGEHSAEAFDEGGLAGARDARDANADGIAGAGEDSGDELLRW
jgi:hypothetical protein